MCRSARPCIGMPPPRDSLGRTDQQRAMTSAVNTPDIILLNGASSSGKSTLARALQGALRQPYFHYSADLLVDGGILPGVDRITPDTLNSWNVIRPKFFQGFHRSIPAFVAAGNRLIVEHVGARAVVAGAGAVVG